MPDHVKTSSWDTQEWWKATHMPHPKPSKNKPRATLCQPDVDSNVGQDARITAVDCRQCLRLLQVDGKAFDPITRPQHYNTGKVECIDALEAATTGLIGIDAVCTANAIKYLWRWKMKGGVEDLKKAVWYIERLIRAQKLVKAVEGPKDCGLCGQPDPIHIVGCEGR